jgi:hypothetical protein
VPVVLEKGPRLVMYQKLNAGFWRDPKIRGLSEDGRTLAVYLLTCPERRTEGLYGLPVVLATDELQWTRERLQMAVLELEMCGFARYDLGAQAVFIVRALKFHPPRGPKQIVGAVSKVAEVRDSGGLFWAFLEAADRYAPEFAAALRDRYPGMEPPQRKGYPLTESESETDREVEAESERESEGERDPWQ